MVPGQYTCLLSSPKALALPKQEATRKTTEILATQGRRVCTTVGDFFALDTKTAKTCGTTLDSANVNNRKSQFSASKRIILSQKQKREGIKIRNRQPEAK